MSFCFLFNHEVDILCTKCITLDPFPNKPWFLRVRSTSFLKTLWEKEKLLVTNNFSFSNTVFYQFGKLSAIFIDSDVESANSFNLEVSKICRLGKGFNDPNEEIIF